MFRSLENIDTYLLDMDGTIYLSEDIIDGAIDFINTLREQKKNIIFLSNNSSKNKHDYVIKMKNLGIEIDVDEVFSSGDATMMFLKKKGYKRTYLMGTDALEDSFEDNGFTLVKGRDEAIDAVVLGFDTSLTYDKIWTAYDYIVKGHPFIATHPDKLCPLANKRFMPDTGAMIAMFEVATGISPYVVGKPNAILIDMIVEKFAYDKERMAIVGDRLYTDVKCGNNADITSMLVLSGETSMTMYQSQSEVRADYVFWSVKELNEELKND